MSRKEGFVWTMLIIVMLKPKADLKNGRLTFGIRIVGFFASTHQGSSLGLIFS